MGNQPENKRYQKPQVPPGMPEAKEKDFRNKDLIQNKKPSALDKEAVGKTGCGPDGSYSIDKKPQ